MTDQEAIEAIKERASRLGFIGYEANSRFIEAADIAISALEERIASKAAVCLWKEDGVYLISPHKEQPTIASCKEGVYRYKYCPICGNAICEESAT